MTDRPEIHLRNCPMCHAAPDDEDGVTLTGEVLIDRNTGSHIYTMSYTCRCINCGVSVSDEYLSDAVRLWNGDTRHD